MNTTQTAVGAERIDAVEVRERLDWQAMRAGQAATVTIDTATLSFLPNGPHQVAAMANLGAELLQEIQAYRPQFLFKSSPAEIVGALIEEMALSDAARDVLTERRRQITTKGWDHDHDDAQRNDEIAAFAAVYALPEGARDWPAKETAFGRTFAEALIPFCWEPKFGDRRRDLVKAAALLVAEIERIDRAAIAASEQEAS
ncbi:hypothetical protein [Janthinobacterium sp. MDB2-8]|uniref:hypothetical protein n=1 Tax=Janthinobacterium sp. MDB2-8 TaxID=1259338 RepID=UPI003F22B262